MAGTMHYYLRSRSPLRVQISQIRTSSFRLLRSRASESTRFFSTQIVLDFKCLVVFASECREPDSQSGLKRHGFVHGDELAEDQLFAIVQLFAHIRDAPL